MTNTEPSRDELAELNSELVELWKSRSHINPNRQLHGYHDARLHSVYGLASHAYRTGEIGDQLIRDGAWLESVPIVRTSFECAVTAQWNALVPDATEAILNNDYRSRRAMAETLRRSQWAASGLVVSSPSDEDHEFRSNAQRRIFKQRCDDLEPGGAEAYACYRTLCWFSHPTNYVIDSYSDFDDSGLTLHRIPKTDDENARLFQHFCAVSLTIAASALNHLDADQAHASALRRIAEKIGVTIDTKLTAAAKVRLDLQN